MKKILFIVILCFITTACKVRKESIISDVDVEFLFSHNDCYYYRIFTEDETIVFSDCDEKITKGNKATN